MIRRRSTLLWYGSCLLCAGAVFSAPEPLPLPCPACSTFEVVPDTADFAHMCFLAHNKRLPNATESMRMERDIDLDNTPEILERRQTDHAMFNYYVFEDTIVGSLYKGFFTAPDSFRVRRLRPGQTVLEYSEQVAGNSIRRRLEYRDGQWILLP